MEYGNKPTDGGNLILDDADRTQMICVELLQPASSFEAYRGLEEFINGMRAVLPLDSKMSSGTKHQRFLNSVSVSKQLASCVERAKQNKRTQTLAHSSSIC